MAKITGFVVQDSDGSYLTSHKWWISIPAEEAHVFTDSEVRKILIESAGWEFKPARLIPAEVQGDITVLLGQPLSVSDFK